MLLENIVFIVFFPPLWRGVPGLAARVREAIWQKAFQPGRLEVGGRHFLPHIRFTFS
jgi:hypothetical protein